MGGGIMAPSIGFSYAASKRSAVGEMKLSEF